MISEVEKEIEIEVSLVVVCLLSCFNSSTGWAVGLRTGTGEASNGARDRGVQEVRGRFSRAKKLSSPRTDRGLRGKVRRGRGLFGALHQRSGTRTTRRGE